MTERLRSASPRVRARATVSTRMSFRRVPIMDRLAVRVNVHARRPRASAHAWGPSHTRAKGPVETRTHRSRPQCAASKPTKSGLPRAPHRRGTTHRDRHDVGLRDAVLQQLAPCATHERVHDLRVPLRVHNANAPASAMQPRRERNALELRRHLLHSSWRVAEVFDPPRGLSPLQVTATGAASQLSTGAAIEGRH